MVVEVCVEVARAAGGNGWDGWGEAKRLGSSVSCYC
jgi:hypothetical protein